MKLAQAGILPPIPRYGRYLELVAKPSEDKVSAIHKLASMELGKQVVIGFGPGLLLDLGGMPVGHRAFAAMSGSGCEIPSTQCDIWIWVRADDPGQAFHQARVCENLLKPAFHTVHMVDGFRYKTGLDLSGYEDGTENPQGEEAIAATIVNKNGPAMAGSSFVAVQKWQHDLDHFSTFSQTAKDNIIGRRQSDNKELSGAPKFAHVKRTAQEDFEPEAFLLRRSMSWADVTGEGLNFVAFGKSFDAFEAQMRRMIGLDDGIIDGLFQFSRPISGGYYWCPPVLAGKLDLSFLRT